MADSDNTQPQANNQAQPNQQVNTTPASPAPEPSSIPPSADQNLSSTMNKGLNPNSSIPSKPDISLNSTKTMNEEGLKTTK